jgi:hypothetical protein
MTAPLSEYVVYVDESGDHSLEKIDQQFPIFVLAFCLLSRKATSALSADMAEIKCRHFGHDAVVFHEREIRQSSGDFKVLYDQAKRAAFFQDLDQMVRQADFTAIAIAIRKNALITTYNRPLSPYDLGVKYGVERIYAELCDRGEQGKQVTFLFERRGHKEDTELELQFRRVCAGENMQKAVMPFEIRFIPKVANQPGLQLADLIARPIGRYVLDPTKQNRPFEAIDTKIRRFNGRRDGYGLKIFPP